MIIWLFLQYVSIFHEHSMYQLKIVLPSKKPSKIMHVCNGISLSLSSKKSILRGHTLWILFSVSLHRVTLLWLCGAEWHSRLIFDSLSGALQYFSWIQIPFCCTIYTSQHAKCISSLLTPVLDISPQPICHHMIIIKHEKRAERPKSQSAAKNEIVKFVFLDKRIKYNLDTCLPL